MKLRIISGKYKGKVLKGFDIDGTRPTMDRVKESLFAMIQKYVKQSQCLDLYAGSGALGLEALSNGANTCLFVDQNNIAIKNIKENAVGIVGATVIKSNAFQIHNLVNDTFDLIFLDPPYHLHLIGPSLQYLREHQLLRPNAIIVCEYEEEIFLLDHFELLKERKYGEKNIKIIKWRNT